MNQDNRGTDMAMRIYIRHSILSGIVSGLLMNMVIILASSTQTGRSAPGLNAISHILWGRQAAQKKILGISNAVFQALHQIDHLRHGRGRFRTQRHGFTFTLFFTGTIDRTRCARHR